MALPHGFIDGFAESEEFGGRNQEAEDIRAVFAGHGAGQPQFGVRRGEIPPDAEEFKDAFPGGEPSAEQETEGKLRRGRSGRTETGGIEAALDRVDEAGVASALEELPGGEFGGREDVGPGAEVLPGRGFLRDWRRGGHFRKASAVQEDGDPHGGGLADEVGGELVPCDEGVVGSVSPEAAGSEPREEGAAVAVVEPAGDPRDEIGRGERPDEIADAGGGDGGTGEQVDLAARFGEGEDLLFCHLGQSGAAGGLVEDVEDPLWHLRVDEGCIRGDGDGVCASSCRECCWRRDGHQ